MRIVRSIPSMQRLARKWRRHGTPIAFVPTMGYLHAGHVSLMVRARRLVGRKGMVVVSIYVNPTQFGPKEDFGKYPRDFVRDRKICEQAGVDLVFAPGGAQMYPTAPSFSTFVVEESLTTVMEGVSRPTHFRGVTTVVAKLFNIVQPDIAIFGAKDYQQAAVIRRMARDLNFPIRIVVAPTKREPDRLAMSSRNKYLSPDERVQARVLSRAIEAAQRAVRKSPRPIPANRLKRTLLALIAEQPAARVDYVAFFEPDTLRAVQTVQSGTHLALAVFIGRTRLIDNARL